MKTRLTIGILSLFCIIAGFGSAQAEALLFTNDMVSGKTMTSSGYSQGTMTFHTNGSLTCNGYPEVIKCKNWQITQNGILRREFTDSHTGTVMEVQADWKLLTQPANNSFQAQQTSNNSSGTTTVTVTVR